MQYHISSNKRPLRLFDFEALEGSTYCRLKRGLKEGDAYFTVTGITQNMIYSLKCSRTTSCFQFS